MISTVTTPASPRALTILLKGETARSAPTSPASPRPTAAAATPAKSRPVRDLPLLTRDEVAKRICAGQALVLRGELVLNVTTWGEHHPGGTLSLLHFVGRDASDEMAAYHSDAALERMTKFAIGRVEFDDDEGWTPLTPPVQLGLARHPDGVKGHWIREGNVRAADMIATPAGSAEVVELTPEMIEPPAVPGIDRRKERARSKAYHALKARVVEAGLFTPPGPLSGYGKDIVRYLTLFGLAFGLFFFTTGWLGQMASAAALGLCWQQITFLVHDACHSGVTGNWKFDRLLAMTLADWFGGLSASWWCDNHDIHHLITNHPEHDPDIQHIPFFAITSQFFRNMWSTYYKRIMWLDAPSRFLITVQHRLYYIVLSLARFNLYALSYTHLLKGKTRRDFFWRYEVAGLAFYWWYFGSMLHSLGLKMGIAYMLVSHICASPVHVQIVLSHFACSTDDLGPTESFASRQLRTTMDVVCGEDIEFIHGGLHLQVTHHLFPRLPRHNLRKASLLVKEYCKEHDIEYLEYGWIEGNSKVLATLRDVANQLHILKQVADKEIVERMH